MMPPANGGNCSEDDGRYGVEPCRQGFSYGNDGPESYGEVIQEVHEPIECVGKLVKVEDERAGDGACYKQNGVLKCVYARILKQDIAHDASAETRDACERGRA